MPGEKREIDKGTLRTGLEVVVAATGVGPCRRRCWWRRSAGWRHDACASDARRVGFRRRRAARGAAAEVGEAPARARRERAGHAGRSGRRRLGTDGDDMLRDDGWWIGGGGETRRFTRERARASEVVVGCEDGKGAADTRASARDPMDPGHTGTRPRPRRSAWAVGVAVAVPLRARPSVRSSGGGSRFSRLGLWNPVVGRAGFLGMVLRGLLGAFARLVGRGPLL